MNARPRTKPRAASAAARELSVHPGSEQTQQLLRERARLLREIQKKKLQLQRVLDQATRDAERAHSEMKPLVLRHAALVRELRQLFAELLQEGRLGRRDRKEVLRLRRLLELDGILDPLDDDEPEPPWEPESEPESEPQPRRAPGRPGVAPPEVESAAPRGQQQRSIRELFRSLARAIHPDQARHEAERERRTEVMKQVTRAYEEGDLARLLELESAWLSELRLNAADPEQRAAELLRQNRELLAQVRELTREIRDAKAQARAASAGLPPEELLLQAESELDELAALCEYLRRIRDGFATFSDLSAATPPKKRRRR